jgi:putative nucleotidyltransferase with HDIG domain
LALTAGDILKVVPEFDLIEDKELREKALQVWAGELEKYGYGADDLEQMPFTTLIKDNPVSLAAHMRSLARQAAACVGLMGEDYGAGLVIDRDVLIAAVLLHDIGKVGGTEKVEGKFKESMREKLLHHSFSGAGILMAAGMPDEVVHAVALHSKDGEGRRQTPEAVLLHHIDFMNYEALKLHK